MLLLPKSLKVSLILPCDRQVEPWGAVHRKKDKKHHSAVQDPKDRNTPRERSDSRGGRGRGGRGGGRGGLSRGGAPGRGGQNGHRAQAFSRNEPADSTTPGTESADPTAAASKDENVPSTSGWGSGQIPTDQIHDPSFQTTGTGWGESTPWSVDTKLNGTPSPAVQAKPLASVPGQPKQFSKKPATSGLSWAEIARPQEKPAPTPSPATAQPQLTPAPALPPGLPEQPPKVEEVILSPEPEPSAPTAWEDPTTVQESTWEEPQASVLQTPVQTQPEPIPEQEPEIEEPPRPNSQKPDPPQVQEPLRSALPTQVQNQELERSSTPASIVKRPLSSAAHRHRPKIGEQAVVMPNYTPSTEKIGMQFGSLSLGGDDLDRCQFGSLSVGGDDLDSEPTTEAKQAEPELTPEPKRINPVAETKPPAPEPTQIVQQNPAPASAPAQVPVPAPISLPPPISPAKTQTQQNPAASTLFQQNLPQQVQQPNQQVQSHPIPASISQPSISSQIPTPALSPPVVSFTPQSQAVSQPSLANHHQSQTSHVSPQQSLNNNPAPSLYNQHELPSHLNHQTQVQPSPHAPQPQPSVASYTSHFRQQEAPYFHTPTPPASSQESPYGAFGQLGQTLQHQSQPSHTGFGADYGYNDRNNFYDTYNGQGGFTNSRNILGHDDLKGLAVPQTASTLPSSNPQSSQQPSQTNSQPPPTSGQGPQQGYPHPVPYYFPYQNQYYGSPYNSGYGVPQPFVKYPQMFQPGPPGPTSGSPVTKQTPSNVQHSNPYGQNPYSQQHPSSAYDDVSYHSQHQNVGGTLPGNDYKQLYGNPSLQGFMGGLGQTSGIPNSTGSTGGGPQGINQRPGGSPENSFKSYGGPGKDMGGVGTGQNIGVGQGGPPGRLGGVQQPTPGSGFYSAGGRSGSESSTRLPPSRF
ncbi:hypothetical protein BJ322DRAFT_1021427 [Thelephora terrestris]|uniref:Uncharacterized protein n=1 Tax=Thelephora terrestris TaxID=56493 RepID=A0A9P6HGB0_9AGAM|nr:hypothetical protein BJ322DRAFT_1021427 [Thelephora terrestris]